MEGDMKGIVFTEFLDMVEEKFSLDVLDRIITEAALPNDGAYTAVGTYDHCEMVTLVSRLSAAVQVPVPELLRSFGQHLFGRFAQGYPEFFLVPVDAFEFLLGIENRIHTEVRKLYADAELPSLNCHTPDREHLVLEYRSTRPLGDLAEGLIRGCIAHFGEPIDVARQDLPGAAGTHVRFSLTRRARQ
jgi:hypothetical protein